MTTYMDCIFFIRINIYKEIIKSFYNIDVTSVFPTHAYTYFLHLLKNILVGFLLLLLYLLDN